MKIDKLSPLAAQGLQRWAKDIHDDELLFEGIGSLPEHWAWIALQLRYSQDRLEWFPKGKFATIQIIEQMLAEEAKEYIAALTKKPK